MFLSYSKGKGETSSQQQAAPMKTPIILTKATEKVRTNEHIESVLHILYPKQFILF